MDLPRLVDAVLDRLVLPGYSAIGYALRSRTWDGPAADALAGRTVVVTGATGGLGRAAAAGAAALGASVELVVRDADRGERARAAILAEQPDADVRVAVCDVSRLADVRRYAADARRRLSAVHGLVHNAGVLPAERTETPEGHELTLATHVLGPFLLTRELRGLLTAGAAPGDPSRVVLVSSGGMYTATVPVDDPEFRTGRWSGGAAYARTKRMQVVLAEELADDLAADGIVVHAMHPGWADTPGIATSMPRFRRVLGPVLRSAAQGADTAVWLLADPGAGRCTGLFWHDRQPRPTHYLPGREDTPAQRAAVRSWCEDAAAVPDTPAPAARRARA